MKIGVESEHCKAGGRTRRGRAGLRIPRAVVGVAALTLAAVDYGLGRVKVLILQDMPRARGAGTAVSTEAAVRPEKVGSGGSASFLAAQRRVVGALLGGGIIAAFERFGSWVMT